MVLGHPIVMVDTEAIINVSGDVKSKLELPDNYLRESKSGLSSFKINEIYTYSMKIFFQLLFLCFAF